jgi:TRAP-type C4-dicarboxylate transport system permease small subunit
MTNAQNIAVDATRDPGKSETTIFQIPIGRLGLLSSLLMGGACGFIVFFVTFFLAIVGMMIYDAATHTSMLNLDISYRYIAAPVGLLAMAICLTYLLTVWVRRKMSGME